METEVYNMNAGLLNSVTNYNLYLSMEESQGELQSLQALALADTMDRIDSFEVCDPIDALEKLEELYRKKGYEEDPVLEHAQLEYLCLKTEDGELRACPVWAFEVCEMQPFLDENDNTTKERIHVFYFIDPENGDWFTGA